MPYMRNVQLQARWQGEGEAKEPHTGVLFSLFGDVTNIAVSRDTYDSFEVDQIMGDIKAVRPGPILITVDMRMMFERDERYVMENMRSIVERKGWEVISHLYSEPE